MRFFIIHDRWDINVYKKRSIDELKDRYYKVIGILERLKQQQQHQDQDGSSLNTSFNINKDIFVFDIEHEHKRREQLEKLFNRTKEQIEEEQYLLEELKKIEIRKRERERKSHDVNKLLTAVDLDTINEAKNASRQQQLSLSSMLNMY